MLSRLIILLLLFVCCSCDNKHDAPIVETDKFYWIDMKNRWMVEFINNKPYYKLYDGITKQYFYRPVPVYRHNYIIKRYRIEYTFSHNA